MARLRIHEVLVFPQAHAFAIFESGKMFLNNGPKLSAVANGIPVTLTSVALTSLSMSESTATERYIIGL